MVSYLELRKYYNLSFQVTLDFTVSIFKYSSGLWDATVIQAPSLNLLGEQRYISGESLNTRGFKMPTSTDPGSLYLVIYPKGNKKLKILKMVILG